MTKNVVQSFTQWRVKATLGRIWWSMSTAASHSSLLSLPALTGNTQLSDHEGACEGMRKRGDISFLTIHHTGALACIFIWFCQRNYFLFFHHLNDWALGEYAVFDLSMIIFAWYDRAVLTSQAPLFRRITSFTIVSLCTFAQRETRLSTLNQMMSLGNMWVSQLITQATFCYGATVVKWAQ